MILSTQLESAGRASAWKESEAQHSLKSRPSECLQAVLLQITSAATSLIQNPSAKLGRA